MLVVMPEHSKPIARISIARIRVHQHRNQERGAHVPTLIELALAHGMTYAVRHDDGYVILVAEHGALIVDVRSDRTRSVRVLPIGGDLQTLPVTIASDVIPMADFLAGAR